MQRHTCSAFIFHFHIFPCWEQILLCHERLDVDSRDRRSIAVAGAGLAMAAMDLQMQRVESKVQKSLERVRLLLKAEKNPQLPQDADADAPKNGGVIGNT